MTVTHSRAVGIAMVHDEFKVARPWKVAPLYRVQSSETLKLLPRKFSQMQFKIRNSIEKALAYQ